MAKEQLVDESAVAQIQNHRASTVLTARDKALLAYVDLLLTIPGAIDERVTAQLLTHFSPAQIVELTAAAAVFLGFSKLAIALGPVPDDLPRMLMPLPARPD